MYEDLFSRAMTVDAREVADRYRMDLDGRNPKIRLTVITYLLENGIKLDLEDPKPFIDAANAISTFVGEELESFVTDIDAIAKKREAVMRELKDTHGGDDVGPYL